MKITLSTLDASPVCTGREVAGQFGHLGRGTTTHPRITVHGEQSMWIPTYLPPKILALIIMCSAGPTFHWYGRGTCSEDAIRSPFAASGNTARS